MGKVDSVWPEARGDVPGRLVVNVVGYDATDIGGLGQPVAEQRHFPLSADEQAFVETVHSVTNRGHIQSPSAQPASGRRGSPVAMRMLPRPRPLKARRASAQQRAQDEFRLARLRRGRSQAEHLDAARPQDGVLT